MALLPALWIGAGMMALVLHTFRPDADMDERYIVGAAIVAAGPFALIWRAWRAYRGE